jgi:hypothetical protein
MRIQFKRICESNAPLEILANANNDWTHFLHLHRKSHLDFRLLFKDGKREIFLYKARLIYPLPFYRTYIAFREYLPEQRGYHQFYLNVGTGKVNYLNNSTTMKGPFAVGSGTFVFESSRIWKWIPWIFKKLFAFRMRAVQSEDNIWMAERMKNGVFEESACATPVPEKFNLMDEFLKDGLAPP